MGNTFSSVKYTPNQIPYYSLNSFQNLGKIGNGSFGTVLKGDATVDNTFSFHRKTRPVAIKIFSTVNDYSQREIQILNTHNHLNIVKLFGVIWDGDSSSSYSGYVMEYMELGSLHGEIHDHLKMYDKRLISLWIEQIGEGLLFLHSNSIIHRDLKPANILMASRTYIKLADFGLARNVSGRATNTSGPVGTDYYRAPEVFCSNDYGPPADLFSFGVTIWEIIHRKHPHEHGQNLDAGRIEWQIDAEKMNEKESNLLQRCWQQNVSSRPPVKEMVKGIYYVDHPTIMVMYTGTEHVILWDTVTASWKEGRLKDYGASINARVCLDGELYIIGCRRVSEGNRNLQKLGKNMQWIQLADLNVDRLCIKNSCLELNGYIWVIGGEDKYERCLKSVERYDPKTNKWQFMPEMKYSRSDAAAAVYTGRIIVCGGYGASKSVECFDPESGVWIELTPLPKPRTGHSLVSYGNKLVVLGGEEDEQATSSVLRLYPNDKSCQWKHLNSIDRPRRHLATAILDNKIYAIGESLSTSSEVQLFDGIIWQHGPSLPVARLKPSAVLIPCSLAKDLLFS